MQDPFRLVGGPAERITLLFFHHALQGVLVLTPTIHHLRHFRLGDLIGEYAALPDSVMMNVEHDLGGGLGVLLEEFFQHMNDELHRCVVVVQNQHPIEVGPLGFRLDLGDDGSRGPPGPAGTVLIVAHSGSRRGGGRIKSGSWVQHGAGVRHSPRETRQRSGGPPGSPHRSYLTGSRTLSRSPLPAGTDPRQTGSVRTNMGPEPARRKRVPRPAALGPIPGSATRPRLINPVGFNKKLGRPFSGC